jgi:hypothetical protein
VTKIDTDIGLIVSLDGELIVSALLRPNELARRVAATDAAVERQAMGRADVADIAAGGLAAGRFKTPAERAHLANLLLWLATRDAGVADSARRGGVDLTWQICSPAADGERWRLGLHVGDRSEGIAPVDEYETERPAIRAGLGLH